MTAAAELAGTAPALPPAAGAGFPLAAPALNGSSKPVATTTTTTTTATNGLVATATSAAEAALGFSPVGAALAAFAANRFVIVLDSPERENEGDLIVAAAAVSDGQLAFLVQHSSGYLCAPLRPGRARQLGLGLMVPAHLAGDPNKTAYTVSVDAAALPPLAGKADDDSNDRHAPGRRAFTTGISAQDRATTCRLLADPAGAPGPAAFRQPGHVLPLIAVPGGLRARGGHTEAAVELCWLARLLRQATAAGQHADTDPESAILGHVAAAGSADVGADTDVGLIGELVDPGRPDPAGEPACVGAGMLRRDGCLEFGRRWNIPVITIESLTRFIGRVDAAMQKS